MFAAKKTDLRKSAHRIDPEMDNEVRALIDDLDQFFDESGDEMLVLTETQEIEPPQPAELAADAEAAADSEPADEATSMEQAVLDYLDRNGRTA